MTLLFGQFPQAAFVAGQFALHAVVGSVGDVVVPPTVDTPGGGGHRAYIRREKIVSRTPDRDDDIAAAVAVFFTLEHDYQTP